MEQVYRPILKQALKNIWQNKWLWFFGFFGAAISGASVRWTVLFNLSDWYSGRAGFVESFNYLRMFANWWESMKAIKNVPEAATAVGIVAVFALIILAIVFISIVSLASIIKIVNNKNTETFSVRKTVSQSIKKFWPLFWLNILIQAAFYLAFFIFIFVIVLPVMNNYDSIIGSLLYIVASIIFIIFSLSLSFIMMFSACYITEEGSRIMDALKKSLRLFYHHWVACVEISFILIFVGALSYIALTIACFLLALPFILLFYILFSLKSAIGILAILAIITFLFLAIFLAFSGALSAFSLSTWVMAWKRFTQGGDVSKLGRTINNLPSYLGAGEKKS